MIRLLPKIFNVRRQEAFEITFTDGKIETKRKPKWYKQIFKGSVDDEFCLGITLRNGQLEIMSKEKDSDIIIATPVMIQQLNQTGHRNRWFSSIEMCIIDQCDIIFMQNWEHLISTMEMLNIMPTEVKEVIDLRKIRDHELQG